MPLLIPGQAGVVYARVTVTHGAAQPYEAEVLVESDSPWAALLMRACEAGDPMPAAARSEAGITYQGRWSVETASDGPEGVLARIRSYGEIEVTVGAPPQA